MNEKKKWKYRPLYLIILGLELVIFLIVAVIEYKGIVDHDYKLPLVMGGFVVPCFIDTLFTDPYTCSIHHLSHRTENFDPNVFFDEISLNLGATIYCILSTLSLAVVIWNSLT